MKKATTATQPQYFDNPGFTSALSRRQFLSVASKAAAGIAAVGTMPTLFAQSAPTLPARKLHSFGLRVSDVDASLKFYQDLFGCVVQSRQGSTVNLRIGDGPRFFSLSPLAAGQQPGITHVGLAVEGFDPEQARAALEARDFQLIPPPARLEASMELAGKLWARSEGVTGSYYFADGEGLIYQLGPIDHCGGTGSLGNRCSAPEPAPVDGLMELVDISHFTNFVANKDRANAFHTELFDFDFQAYQGPASPIIGIGDRIQFLMYVGGNQEGTPSQPGRVDHVCFTMKDFDVDAVLAKLTDYGLSPRQEPSDSAPLLHWISLRMPNRGGVEGGTPELYFSDPDGIRIQLQDVSYCGGNGYLGDQCPPLA